MKVYQLSILCAECLTYPIVEYDSNRVYIRCGSENCINYQKKYHAPMLDLEEVVETKD